MTLIERDFYYFLISIGYKKHTASNYKYSLQKFTTEGGFDNLVNLADNVLILLDLIVHNDSKIDKRTLDTILRYKNILTLFNSFLFDIHYPRKFIPHPIPDADYTRYLTTDQKYIPGKQQRTLIDIDKDTGKPTGKQWFDRNEVAEALHIDLKVLTRWNKMSKEERIEKCIPNRYKAKDKNDIDLSYNMNKKKEFGYGYYTLKELNDFLGYQFDHGTGIKREQYLSDIDTRKRTQL